MTIHEQINKVRKENKIAFQELADKTDNYRSNISKILRGKIEAKEGTLIKIANALGYTLKLVKNNNDGE
jgi:transcriptional regulator with XRE-family HTH domain